VQHRQEDTRQSGYENVLLRGAEINSAAAAGKKTTGSDG